MTGGEATAVFSESGMPDRGAAEESDAEERDAKRYGETSRCAQHGA